MGKWDSKLSTIQTMTGKFSTEEIAGKIGTSISNLHKICHRNNISLPRDPNSYAGGRKESQDKKIEAAKNLLLRAGYRIHMSAPFGKLGT